MSIEDIRLVRVNNDNGDAPQSPLAATNDEEDDSTERDLDDEKTSNRLAAASLILAIYLFFRFAGRFSYDCTQCDNLSNKYYTHRIHRTACRVYCAVDTNKDGYLSKHEFWRHYSAGSSGGYIGEDTFAKKWIHVTGMCRHEALQAFDTIADLGDGSSIDAATFNAAFDVLCNWTFCNASTGIMESAFPSVWNQFYDIIEDEANCKMG